MISDVLQNDDLLQYIFSFLDPRKLSKARLVSKNWNRVGSVEILWQRICQEMGPHKPLNESWKQCFYALQKCRNYPVLAQTFTIPDKTRTFVEADEIYYAISTPFYIQLVGYYDATDVKFMLSLATSTVLTSEFLICTDHSHSIHVFDRFTQVLMRTIPPLKVGRSISKLVCDGSYLFAFTNDCEFEKWDIKTGDLILSKPIPFQSLTDMKRAGNYLLIEGKGTRNGIDVLDLNTLESMLSPSSPLYNSPLAESIFSPGCHLALHPHRLWLAVMGSDQSIVVWDLKHLNEKPLFRCQSPKNDKKGEIKCICSVWKNDILFVSYSFYKQLMPSFTSFQGSLIEAWDIQNNQRLYEYPYFHQPRKFECMSDQIVITTVSNQIITLQFGNPKAHIPLDKQGIIRV